MSKPSTPSTTDDYVVQSKSETLPLPIGAFLKYEATTMTRMAVPAPKGTTRGTFVDFPLRTGKKLLALTDEQNGTVIVQPYNCVIDLTYITIDTDLLHLQQDGDPYGIVYQGTPKMIITIDMES